MGSVGLSSASSFGSEVWAGVGFLSRFCFAVMELGGQVSLCDGIGVGDSLHWGPRVREYCILSLA